MSLLNKEISQGQKTENFLTTVNDFYFILDICGFKFNPSSYDFPTKLLIERWQRLRRKEQYSQADEIRNELQKRNIL